jgi:hypothetical protein
MVTCPAKDSSQLVDGGSVIIAADDRGGALVAFDAATRAEK